MSPPIDLALYNRYGHLTAFAEIKNKLGTSQQWARHLRRNMLAHGGYANADFFLIITPDRLYLWKNAGTDPTLVPPTHEVDIQPMLEPYFKSASVHPHHASGNAFELIVTAWLGDLMRLKCPSDQLGCGQNWLNESGFLTAIQDGRIEYEVAV
jgi:hypothetical protein